MSISSPTSKADRAEEQRWRERYGEDPSWRSEVQVLPGGLVQVGDEIFTEAELAESDRKHPQDKKSPFKPHHYVLQSELTEMLVSEAKKEIDAIKERHAKRKALK